MCSTGKTVITVESTPVAAADPPPDTATSFTCGQLPCPTPFPYTALFRSLAPPAKASLRVQVVPPAGHVHPVPAIDTSVSPVGAVSVTVTVPLVGPAPAAFDTVTV